MHCARSIPVHCILRWMWIWMEPEEKALKCILFKNLLECEVVRMRAVDGSFAIGRCMFHFFSPSIWYCQRDLFVIAKINSLPACVRWWWWYMVFSFQISARAAAEEGKKRKRKKRILAISFSFWMNFQQTIINKWIDARGWKKVSAWYCCDITRLFLLLLHQYYICVIETAQFLFDWKKDGDNKKTKPNKIKSNSSAYWWAKRSRYEEENTLRSQREKSIDEKAEVGRRN